jgi:hypothetical protein
MLLYLFPTEHISRQWVLTRQDAVREDLLELFALHCMLESWLYTYCWTLRCLELSGYQGKKLVTLDSPSCLPDPM